MRRNGSNHAQSPWASEINGLILENDFTLKGSSLMPMTSAGKRKNIRKKGPSNGWVIDTNNSNKKLGLNLRRTIKPQTLAEMLAYARPSTQAGKNVKGFFRNSGTSPKTYKLGNGFLRRQISQGKISPSNKPTLHQVKSTVTIKPNQITLSPKYKDYYQNQNFSSKDSQKIIEIESPVDNLTATSGASNTATKISLQKPAKSVYKNTQGLQGSIYSASNSIDVRTRIEKETNNDQIHTGEPTVKRAITESGKVRLKQGAINRIREAKIKAEKLVGKEGNNAVFQYQFEMQNKDEET
jgi:hypothetical protein